MDTAIASDVTNTVDASRDFELLVTVRDRTGGPLAKALVEVRADGGAVWSGQTDATGLLRFSGRAPGALLSVRAEYRPPSGADFDVVYRGEATLALDPARCEARRAVTVLVSIARPLKHLFPWQNPAVRKLVHWYMKDPDDSTSFDDGFADRMRQLRFVIEAYSEVPVERELFDARVKNNDTRERIIFNMEQGPTQKLRDDLETQNQLQRILDQLGASSEGATHKQVMKTLMERTFQWSRVNPADPDGPRETIPDWLKYGIVQLSGMRYRGAAHSYYPIAALVYNLREKEIDEQEHGPHALDPSAERQRAYAREYADHLSSRPDWMDDVQRGFLRQLASIPAFDRYPFAKQRTTTGATYDAIPLRGPRAQTADGARAKKLQVAQLLGEIADGAGPLSKDELLALRAAACALSECWLREAVTKATDRAPANEDELQGAIVDRFQNRGLPEIVWRRAVMCTRLFNDFADASWDSHPGAWNRPEVPAEWRRVFRDPTGTVWFEHHKQTLEPVPTGAVCNQITEMLGHARGVSLGFGILGQMEAMTLRGAKGTDGLTGVARKLFRPSEVGDMQPGDLIIWLQMCKENSSWTVKADKYDMDLLTDSGQSPRATTLDSLQANASTSDWSWGLIDNKVVRCRKNKYSDKELAAFAEKGKTPPAHTVQVLSVLHVATVARVDQQVLTFETAHPAGMRVRTKLTKKWNVFVGRPPAGVSPRDLAYYLNPRNVIDRTSDD